MAQNELLEELQNKLVIVLKTTCDIAVFDDYTLSALLDRLKLKKTSFAIILVIETMRCYKVRYAKKKFTIEEIDKDLLSVSVKNNSDSVTMEEQIEALEDYISEYKRLPPEEYYIKIRDKDINLAKLVKKIEDQKNKKIELYERITKVD